MAGEDGPYKGRGIYPVTSLLNHACISNTRNIVTGRTLEVRLSSCSHLSSHVTSDPCQVRACVPIPLGAALTTHYVSPLLDTAARRRRLRDKWFFHCNCSR